MMNEILDAEPNEHLFSPEHEFNGGFTFEFISSAPFHVLFFGSNSGQSTTL